MTQSVGKKKTIAELLSVGKYKLAAEAAQFELDKKNVDLRERVKLLAWQLNAYNRMQWLVEAKSVCKSIDNLSLSDHNCSFEKALFYVLAGQPREARRYFKLAHAKHPDKQLIESEIAITFEQEGDKERALKLYDRVIEKSLNKKRCTDYLLRSFQRKAGLTKLSKVELEFLEAVYRNPEMEEWAVSAAFAIATSLSHTSISEEQDWLIKANRRSLELERRKGGGWNLKAEQEIQRLLFERFGSARPSWLQVDFEGYTEQRFIFVLGMPRSGTTLLEPNTWCAFKGGQCWRVASVQRGAISSITECSRKVCWRLAVFDNRESRSA